MSITPRTAAHAGDPAERLPRLVDDAAVFPPGAPLPDAPWRSTWPAGRSHGPTWSAHSSCPPPRPPSCSAVPRAAPLDVALVARPGTALDVVERALGELGRDARRPWRREIAWSAEWDRVAGVGPARVRGGPARTRPGRRTGGRPDHTAGKSPLQAKMRTGATDALPVPDATELATFLRTCVDMELASSSPAACTTPSRTPPPRASASTASSTSSAPPRLALAHAAEVPELETLLEERDPAPLLDVLTA